MSGRRMNTTILLMGRPEVVLEVLREQFLVSWTF